MRWVITLFLAALSGSASGQDEQPRAADAGAAINRGLAFLVKDGLAWKEKHNCASCHHAALAIWALVAGSTLPLVVPFIVVDDARLALRLSHATAVLMLFALGWRIGRWAGAAPGASGAVLAIVGSILAALCVLLGG